MISPSVRVAVVAAATIAAVLERLWFARTWGERGSLTSVFYYGDARRFVEYAVAIATGQTFDNGIPFHPPGWPLLMAAFMKAAGAVHGDRVAVPAAAIKMLVAVLSGASVGAATLLAGEIAGLGAMLAVAVLGPFSFAHIVEGTVANSEAIYGLLVALAVWASWRWLRIDPDAGRVLLDPPGGTTVVRAGWAALAGVLGGAAMLVRAEFLAWPVVMAAIWWVERRRRSLEPAALATFFAAFAIVLVPTTVWHWRALDAFNESHRTGPNAVAGPLPRFAPVTSYGPFNFAMANHENADGGPNRDHPMFDRCSPDTESRLGAGQLDLACPAVYDLYVHGYAIGFWWLVDHPGDAIDLLGKKIGYTIGFLSHGYFVDDLGAGVEGTRRRVDLIDPAHEWLLPVHLALFVVGMVLLRNRPLALAIAAAPLVALAGSVAMFYGYVRLGAAYLPFVWIFEGAALAWICGRLSGPATRRRAAIACAVVLVLAGVEGLRSRDVRAVTVDGVRAPDGSIVNDETVEIR